jgi:hypothetical protein
VELGGFFNQAGANFGQPALLDFTCGVLTTLTGIQAQLSALLGNASSIHL